MIEPYYQIFKEKLKEVNPDLEKNGLLCPIVLDKDGVTIRSGTHRYEYFKDKYESTLCYVGDNGEETKFFQLLNVFCWKNHPVKQSDFLKSMYEKGPI